MLGIIKIEQDNTPRAEDIDWHDPSLVALCILDLKKINIGGDKIRLIKYLRDERNLAHVGNLLFHASQRSYGKNRATCATALLNLENLGADVEYQDRYRAMIRNLNTNLDAIRELKRLGKEEAKQK